jgi:hypothetical protein
MSPQQQTPSFQPWLGRVRMARAWSAVIGLVVVTAVSHGGDRAWDESLLRGFVGAVVLYFVAWASALFLFGELYNVQVHRVREGIRQREEQRQRQLQELYDSRMRELHGIPDGGSVEGLGKAGATTQLPNEPTTSGFAPPMQGAA